MLVKNSALRLLTGGLFKTKSAICYKNYNNYSANQAARKQQIKLLELIKDEIKKVLNQ